MNWSGLNVLITGGAGHIGSNLTLELIKKGENIFSPFNYFSDMIISFWILLQK